MFTYFNARRDNLFASAFAKQIVKIENGFQKVLSHGNLNSQRTVLDIRDAMEAYYLAAIRESPVKFITLVEIKKRQ